MTPATRHGSRPILTTRLVLILALLAVGLAGPAAPPARAETLVVTNTATVGPGSLRQAILDAASGDTITFDASLSGGTIFLGSPLSLLTDLTIDGSALAEPVTLSGNGAVRVLEVTGGTTATLNGLVIAQGAASDHDDEVGSEDDHGGGIYNAGTLTVTDCTLSDNSADRFGGAIYSSGVLTVTRCTFADNNATAAAGGILSYGALTVVDSTFTGNTGSEAGAINSQGVLTVSGSTFSGNTAMTGGAIGADSTAMVTNSTFYSNTAAIGGGIAANSQSALTLSHCTFSGNAAGYYPESFGRGGGAIAVLGVLTYTHTIMADSVNGDCRLLGGGTVESNIANLVEDGSCGADLLGDPLLAPLADNGGPTHTMALLPGSKALNAGDAATCPAAMDQRGVARPQGAGCDIGAYEQKTPAVTTDPAIDVTATGATLRGTVNARNSPTTVAFEYGLTAGYGMSITVPSLVTGTVDTAVSAVLTGLAPNTTYHYRVVAENGAGTVHGADRTLTTAVAVPAATTLAATDVTQTGATLHGAVNARNSPTTVTFEYGLTASYGMSVTVPSAVTGTVDTEVSAILTGLLPNTTYHYRVVADSEGGTASGVDATFTTLPPPRRDLYLPVIRR